MRKSRFSEEQIIKVLQETEAGAKIADLCRRHGISEHTFHRWKAKFGGMEINEARRLRQQARGREPAAEAPGGRPDPG